MEAAKYNYDPFSLTNTTVAYLSHSNSIPPLKVESLEDLLVQIIANYQKVSTVPSGEILGNPYIDQKNSGTGDILHLHPTCAYENGYPTNFGKFHSDSDNHKKHSMTEGKAFAWFARSRLRCSCSTLGAAFSECVIPILKEKGISSLYSKTLDNEINLSNLEIFEVTFIPKHQDTLQLDRGIFRRPELVELLSGDNLCHRNVLKCSQTGAVVDLTLGQFTGTVTPHGFLSLGSFISVLPGEFFETRLCPRTDIQQQIARDESHVDRSLDATLQLFALRVIRSLQEKAPFCSKCHCPPSPCKQALCCSKECQVLSWSEGHKDSCTVPIISQTKQ